MTEERIIERTDTPAGTTTIIERRGSGGLLIGLIVLFGAILAFFLFSMNKEESRQTDAVSQAAQSVGEGAKKVGDAADRAADKYTGEKN